MGSDVLIWAGEVRADLIHQIEAADRDNGMPTLAGAQPALVDLHVRLALIEKLIAACEEQGN